jgi:ribosomal protein S18 acetylase RimI-like enzyme/uncharacterized protein YciI
MMTTQTATRLYSLGVIVLAIGYLVEPISAFALTGSYRHYPSAAGRGLVTRRFGSATATSANDEQQQQLKANLQFRPATPEDMAACYTIESVSYPADEAATREALEFRQAQATPYFRVATTTSLDDSVPTVIGFCCGTRCQEFTEESMSTTHAPDGKLLAIHSVVVDEQYRRQGIATVMLNEYMESISSMNAAAADDGLESTVLLAKSNLLSFYVNCGFSVLRPSPIVHGSELWYELEKRMGVPAQTIPKDDEQWFVKTETFCKPFLQVKSHLEAHKEWVAELRRVQGRCITSGYRVDSEGKPGGGGLMFLAAKSYDEAMALVLQDPLVANDCVDWQLNGWIGQVGDVQLR